MSKQDILNDVSKFQRACDNFIRHDAVIYCVSSLIYELREVAEQLDDYDTYMTLTGGKPDYEEAARAFIMDDADLDQLEEIAEENGYWSDAIDEVDPGRMSSDEDWVLNKTEMLPALRDEVWKITYGASDGPEWVCNHFNLDPEYSEVYEHWLCSTHFGNLLRSKGEIVEEYLGLLVWARTTTGQSISQDWVVTEIMRELDDDHWVWRET